MVIDTLQDYSCLDDFLCKAPEFLMFWFFQRRDAFPITGNNDEMEP